MEDCIFCKIAEGKSPSYKILEDELKEASDKVREYLMKQNI
jgi:diadenosine tetraphosphate (Ap4A) HIT family hydrolase